MNGIKMDSYQLRMLIDRLLSIKKINGPNSLTVMELNDKLIFLFGDFHGRSSECTINLEGNISIIDFFELFSKNSPVCSDLFIESLQFVQGNDIISTQEYYNRSNDVYSNTSLFDVITRYWSCFGVGKEECDVGNMRVHNIDFRRNISSQFSFLDIPYVENRDAYLNLLRGLLYWDIDLVTKSFNEININGEHLPVNSYIIENMTNYQRISKQYESIPNADLLKQEIIREFINGPYSFPLSKDSINTYLTAIGEWLMDIYGIGRILKSVYSYEDSKILMVYAGQNHIRKYERLLQTVYGAKIVFQAGLNYDVLNFYKSRGISEGEIINEYSKMIDIRSSLKSCIDIDTFSSVINYLIPIFMNETSCSVKKSGYRIIDKFDRRFIR